MARRAAVAVGVILSLGTLPARSIAYEVFTHELITENAADQQSNLTRSLATVGLSSVDQVIPAELFGDREISAMAWMKHGANSEDDTVGDDWSRARYRNHFHDPVNHRGLYFDKSPCGITVTGSPSPDWGLEEGGIDQTFSLKDARAYFYQALTQPERRWRAHFLGLTFETLGHVVHLIQDAAQPQHTRNDSHGGLQCFGTPSAYEKYTERFDVRQRLSFAGYPTVVFSGGSNVARSFWETADVDHRGMAQYSNRGFVTWGTNFDQAGSPEAYPLPALTEASYWEYQAGDGGDPCDELGIERPRDDSSGNPLPCVIDFAQTLVEDSYDSGRTQDNPYTSARALYYEDVKYSGQPVTYTSANGQSYSTTEIYTLNRYNYDSAHEFLIPRAVGYSAGLIDYFFRGEIDLVTDASNSNQYVIQNNGSEFLDGEFTIYYDDTEDIRRPLQAKRTAIAAHSATDIQFSAPISPPPKFPGVYTLVFNGQMGAEGAPMSDTDFAVAAALVQPFWTRIPAQRVTVGPAEDTLLFKPSICRANSFVTDGDVTIEEYQMSRLAAANYSSVPRSAEYTTQAGDCPGYDEPVNDTGTHCAPAIVASSRNPAVGPNGGTVVDVSIDYRVTVPFIPGERSDGIDQGFEFSALVFRAKDYNPESGIYGCGDEAAYRNDSVQYLGYVVLPTDPSAGTLSTTVDTEGFPLAILISTTNHPSGSYQRVIYDGVVYKDDVPLQAPVIEFSNFHVMFH